MMTKCLRQPARINVKALVTLVIVFVVLMGGAAGGYKVRKRIVAHRAQAAGMAALEKQDWVEACKHLKLYLSKYPDDVDMLAEYAKANLAVRPQEAAHVGQAIGAYRRLLQRKPGDADICQELTKLYFKIGDFAEAAYVCRQRLEVDPSDPRASLMLGRALAAQRKHEEAMDVLRKLVEQHPEEVQAYGLLGALAMEEDSPSAQPAALRWLDQAVEANPESAEARVQRARFRRTIENDAMAAREDLEAAESTQPSDPNLRLSLAAEWMSLRELDRAQAQLEMLNQGVAEGTLAVSDLDPDDLLLAELTLRGRLALLQRASDEAADVASRGLSQLVDRRRTLFLPLAVELYLAANRVDDARQCLDDYRKAMENTRVEGEAWGDTLVFLRAMLAVAEGKPYDAINGLESLAARAPDVDVLVWRVLAAAYEATGQWPRAIDAFEKYLKRAPGDFDATLRLAKAYRPRDVAKAAGYAAVAAQLRPDDLEAKLLRIETQLNALAAGRIDAARLRGLSQELGLLRESNPEVGQVRILLARIAALEDRADDVVAELEQAVAQCDDKLTSAMVLATYYQNLGRTEEALQTYERAIANHPDVALPRFLLARLQRETDRQDDARRTLESAVADLADRERFKAQAALAEFMLQEDARAGGIDLLRTLAAENPDDVRIRVALLGLPEIQQDRELSQTLIDELHALEGERGLRWRVEQAKLWLRGKEWTTRQRDVEAVLEDAIRADPGGPEPMLVLGRMYETLGDVAKAEDAYRRAVDADPRRLDAASRLLVLLQRQRRFDEADAVLKRFAGDPEALRAQRVNLAIQREEYEPAIGELETRVAADPKDADAGIMLARLLWRGRGDADAALNLLTEIEAAAPESRAAVNLKVSILHSLGREEEARALVESEVRRRDDFLAYLLRGEYYALTGQLDQAEQDYVHLTTQAGAEAEGYLMLGRFYQAFRTSEQAVAAWEKGLKRDPGHLGLQRELAKVLIASDRPQEHERGLKLLNEVLDRLPNDVDLMFVRATTLLNEGTPEAAKKATEILERVVQLNAGHLNAYKLLVRLALEGGDLARVDDVLTGALGANPQDPELRLLRAGLEAERGNSAVARELAESVLEGDREDVGAHSLLAELALRAGDLSPAQDHNDKALKANPADEAAQLRRARILDARGMLPQAVEGLESYCETDAGQSKVAPLLMLAELYGKLKDWAAARQRIDEATQLEPDSSDVLGAHLQWLAAQGRFDELRSALAERRQKEPVSSLVLTRAASLLLSSDTEGDLREARSLFDEATAGDSARPEAYFGLGHAAYRLGEFDVAEQAWRRVLELDPFHAGALNDMAWILSAQQGNPEEALQLADRGVARYPNDPHLRDTRGVILTALGRLEDARKDLEKCVTLAADLPPTRARALLHLGRVLVQQGELATAGPRLEEALAVDRQHDVLTSEERAEIEQLINSSTQSLNDQDRVRPQTASAGLAP